MKKYFAEAVGTFALVFCGTGAIVVNEEFSGIIGHAGIAATFGLVVMAMIYALGTISGAHLNPAVTIAFWISQKFPTKDVLPYVASQVCGAILASLLIRFMFETNETLGITLPSGTSLQSFIMEFVLCFFLMLVIMSVSHGSKEQGLFAGFAVGSVVMLGALFGGPVSGASLNPARSLAPALVTNHWEHLWIYFLAPISGTVSGMISWKIIYGNK